VFQSNHLPLPGSLSVRLVTGSAPGLSPPGLVVTTPPFQFWADAFNVNLIPAAWIELSVPLRFVISHLKYRYVNCAGGVAVGVGVGVGVGVLEGVPVGVNVLVGVLLGVPVGVRVFVGVLLGVPVGVNVLVGVLLGVPVGVNVFVGVFVGVLLGVPVGVNVRVGVLLGVPVGVNVLVGVFVGVEVGVGVGDAFGLSLIARATNDTSSVAELYPMMKSAVLTVVCLSTRWHSAADDPTWPATAVIPERIARLAVVANPLATAQNAIDSAPPYANDADGLALLSLNEADTNATVSCPAAAVMVTQVRK